MPPTIDEQLRIEAGRLFQAQSNRNQVYGQDFLKALAKLGQSAEVGRILTRARIPGSARTDAVRSAKLAAAMGQHALIYDQRTETYTIDADPDQFARWVQREMRYLTTRARTDAITASAQHVATGDPEARRARDWFRSR